MGPQKKSSHISQRDIYLNRDPIHYARKREGHRMVRRLNELLDQGAPALPAKLEVKGVTCDSRKVLPGFVFVAVNGSKADGRIYVEDAVKRGAGAIISEQPVEADVPVIVVPDARAALADLAAKFHGHPTSKMNVLGVTGTKGKSTTTYLVRAILEAAGERAGLIGTIQYMIGSRVIPSPLTTPPADELQRYFAEMAAAGCRSAVMEVSSIALHQLRTRSMHFAGGIFTNLTRDHLDYHKTIEAYREAKGIFFEQLAPKAVAAINVDDPNADYFIGRTKARVIRYGLDGKADVSAKIAAMSFQGLELRMKLGSEEVTIHSKLAGRHNAYNILGAAATTWAMGYNFEHIKAGLEGMTAVPGRLERVDAGQPFSVFVDYAHTEDSLRNVLTALRAMKGSEAGRLIVVFGCGGDRDRGKRPLMGHAAEELSDFFILTSDNPRTEEPFSIIRQIEAGIENHSKYLVEPDRHAAIKIALGMARKDDVVLIAGKGHEPYQIIGETVKPFDDRAVSAEILKEIAASRTQE